MQVPADLEDTHKSIILATMVAETKQTTKKKTKKEKPPKMIVDTTRASVIMNGVTDKAPPVVVVGNSSSTATCIFREGEEEEKVISPLSAASAQRPEGIIDMLDKDIEFFGSALGGTRVADILNNKQEEAYIIQELLKTGNDDNGTGENDCNNNDAAAAGDAFNASCSLLTRFAAQEAEKGSFEWIGAELMSRTEECVMDGCGAHDGNNNNSAQRNVIIPPLSNEAICHFSWKEREFVK